MNYIGMDIHKQFTVAVVKDEQGNKLAENKFDNSKNNFQQFLQLFKPEETKIVMESTGVWEYIYDMLDNMNYSVKLANPMKTRAIAEARIKTDSIDASTLADLLRANLVAESYIPPKEIRKLRQLTRERIAFVKHTTQIKNNIHAILLRRGMQLPNATLCKSSIEWLRIQSDEIVALKDYLDLLEFYEKKMNEIEKQIYEATDKDKNAGLLMTIPGIASVRALNIIAEIGNINRFSTADKLCSYAGLVPSLRQSGNTLRFGRLIQQSSKILKSTLIEASWNIIRMKERNHLNEFYHKLCKKKGKQKAICATARKLCCVIHAMLTKQTEFIVL